jgi:hypothetical protein
MKKCAYCGREANADDAINCAGCGTDINDEQSAGIADANICARLGNLFGHLTPRRKLTLLILSFLLVIVAVCFASVYLHHPQMRESEVIRFANDASINSGFILNEYDSPHAKFEPWKHDRTWIVTYGVKMALPWEHPLPARHSAHGAPKFFYVIVADKTGRTVFGVSQGTIGIAEQVPPPPGVKFWGIFSNQDRNELNTN